METSSNSSNLVTNVENWCHTKINQTQFTCIWTIHRFSLFPEETGQRLSSASFSSKEAPSIKWCLDLYPRGETANSKTYVSLNLRLLGSDRDRIRVLFSFAVVNDRREKVRSWKPALNSFVRGASHGAGKWIPREELLDETNKLLTKDQLTVFCEVDVLEDVAHMSGEGKSMLTGNTQYSLPVNLGSLIDTGHFSDAVVTVEGEDFRVHRAILAARSPVFSELLTEPKISLPDIDVEIFLNVLHYIYTDTVSDIKNTAHRLLPIADRYALEGLKAMCEETLGDNLTVQNAVETLVIADRYSAKQLKSRVIEFVKGFTREVIDSAAFTSVLITNPHLLVEVFCIINGKHTSQTP